MKKVDSLKISGVNVLADNAGEKKNILDGCKFCMKVDGFKCDQAEALFNHRSVLSSHLPCYHGVRFDVQDPPKPLEFPLMCFRHFVVEGLHCVDCNVTYKARYNPDTENYDTSCPICGSDVEDFVDKHGDYYAYNTSYLHGMYCHDCGIVYCERYNVINHKIIGNSNCPHCGKKGEYLSDMINELYPTIYSGGETEEAYDILAGYYDEDEYDDFGGLKAWEVGESLQEIALKEALSMCYDELGGYFSEDEDTCYRDDEEEYWHFNCYEELYWVNEYDWLDEEYWFDVYDLERYYRSLAFQNITMSTREIMVALDLVESIFCGNQHPTNEEKYQRNIEFLRNYEADDAYRLTPCYGNCDSMCELCPIDGREKEYVFKNIEERINYAKASLPYIKEQLFSLYAELLDVTLILNQTVDGGFNKFVSLIREVCVRMDNEDVDNFVALVVSLFETAKALARVDTSYMRAKDAIEVNT